MDPNCGRPQILPASQTAKRRSVSVLNRVLKSFAILPVVAISLQAQNAPTAATPASGTKKILTADDYTKWRTIDASQISADGKWVAYGVRFTNVVTPDAKPVLHLVNLATNEDVAIADASNAQFSSDSKWVVYQIEIQPTPPARGRPSGDSAAGADTANRNRPAGSTQVQRR